MTLYIQSDTLSIPFLKKNIRLCISFLYPFGYNVDGGEIMGTISIADRLRELRAAKKLNQDEVAEACGISRIALARYETGTRTPRAVFVARLAKYYGVTIDYLMGADTVEAPAQPTPPQQKPDPFLEIISKLSPENRALVEQRARKLLESQQNNSET